MLLVYQCDRCGRVHKTIDTMQEIVRDDGKSKLLVCADDRNCYRKSKRVQVYETLKLVQLR